MDIHPARTETDYKAALKEVSALMESDPDPGTPQGDRLDILATLVQAYEGRNVPIAAPDPVEALKFRMEQGGPSSASAGPPALTGDRRRSQSCSLPTCALRLPACASRASRARTGPSVPGPPQPR